MSGIDFKSFLIGILITVIFVFTTGISLSGNAKYVAVCGGESVRCFILNTETGVGNYVHRSQKVADWIPQGTKPNF
tara:strand:- start:360 stop:587 length:228 start_codon:yes stop_codon:yes gene_type:complete